MCPNGERLSRTEKLVALVLADSHQDRCGAHTFPSVMTISEDALMDERTCRRVLGSLERKGVIVRERGERQGRGQVTFYIFPALDGVAEKSEKGGQNAPLSNVDISIKRRAKGGQKGDILRTPLLVEQEQEQVQKQTPPNPLANEGENATAEKPTALKSTKSAPASGDLFPDRNAGEVGRAVDQVMQGGGFTRKRLRRVLEAVIRQRADLGEVPASVALAMIAAWKSYTAQGARLRARWGADKFFADGYWNKPDSWMWDSQVLADERLRSEASVGSNF
jgi:hypothetical protein